MERCGKINAVNSVAESWTGMGVVAGVCATVLMMQRPHVKHVDTHWRITLLQILQEVRSICKTRNQLILSGLTIRCDNAFLAWSAVRCHFPRSWPIISARSSISFAITTC